MKAQEILNTAIKITAGDRNDTHGDMVKNHSCIAAMWQGYLHAKVIAGGGLQLNTVTPEDVANMMECLKIARRLTGHYNPDDYIDGAGYAACAGQIRAAI